MKKLFKIILIAFSLVFFITACGSSGGGDSVTSTSTTDEEETQIIQFPKVYDLGSTNALYISSQVQTLSPSFLTLKKGYSNIGDITTILNKIKDTQNVEVEEVAITYEEVAVDANTYDENSTVTPTEVKNIDDNYLFIENTIGYTTETSLVRKSDGIVLEKDIGYLLDNSYSADIQTDSAGNIYTIMSNIYGDGELYKITVNGDTVTKEFISRADEDVDGFSVDLLGNVAYLARKDIYTNLEIYRTVGGDYYNFASGLAQVHLYTDFNQRIIFCGYDGDTTDNVICETIDPVDRSTAIYMDINGSTGISMPNVDINYVKNKDRAIATAGRGVNTSDDVYHEIYEFVNPTDTFRKIDTYTLFGFYTLQIVDSSDDFYYIFGENNVSRKLRLTKIDPADDNATVLIDNNDYNISKMNVTKDSVVNFIAVDINGTEVVGQVSATGVVTAQEIVGEDITSLEAISN